jgi:hypothetical protein
MEPTQHRPNPRRLCVLCPDYGKEIFSPASMDCFARNSALRAALDPATDDLLFDIVINQCGARTHCRPPAPHPLHAGGPSSLLLSPLVREGFASMLLMVLPMRSAGKSENSSRINRVLCYRWNRDFYFAVHKAPRHALQLIAGDFPCCRRNVRPDPKCF